MEDEIMRTIISINMKNNIGDLVVELWKIIKKVTNTFISTKAKYPTITQGLARRPGKLLCKKKKGESRHYTIS